MKSLSTALQAHLRQDVTTIATCWMITRTDGVVLAFTDHDQDLVVTGQRYQASSGYQRTAIKSDHTLAVDNMNILGILDSAAISDRDVKAGKFDFAQVNIFVVNWAAPSMSILKMRQGWFGEVTSTPLGTFQTELRGITQALITDVTEQYSPTCRADLGDARCKIPIMPAPWSPGKTVAVGDFIRDPSATTDTALLALYKAMNAGTTGTTNPVFSATQGDTTADNGVAWVSVQPYRYAGVVSDVLSATQFNTVDPMVFAGYSDTGKATVVFQSQMHNGTSFVISLGDVYASLTTTADYTVTDAASWLASNINSSVLGPLMVATVNSATVTIVLNNASNFGRIRVTNNPSNLSKIFIVGFGENYFTGGVIQWITGANAGTNMEIKSSDSYGCTLYLSMPYQISSGDRFYYQPGCDKRRHTCYRKFNNILNFRGEPDLPGFDVLVQYPDATG